MKLSAEGGLAIKWSALHSGVHGTWTASASPCAVKLQCYASSARLPSTYVHVALSSARSDITKILFFFKKKKKSVFLQVAKVHTLTRFMSTRPAVLDISKSPRGAVYSGTRPCCDWPRTML